MGFFDKLKAMKNAVTGGAAKVEVETGDGAELGEPFAVKVRATAKADLNISSVYVIVRAVEQVTVPDERGRIPDEIHGEYETFEDRVEVTGAQELKAGEQYEWECEITLSDDDCNPTFDGEICQHIWQIQAGLDAKGNDPDSGWVHFVIE